MLSPANASTKIELTKERPKMPPTKNNRAKTILEILPTNSELLDAISFGISLHPSPVNSLKMVKRESPGSPNKSGDILPKIVDDRMEIINSRIANATQTMNEVLMATPIPFNSPLILGINFSRRKDLKTRNVLSDNKMFVAYPVSKKMFIRDGIATRVMMKSNLFQPSLQ